MTGRAGGANEAREELANKIPTVDCVVDDERYQVQTEFQLEPVTEEQLANCVRELRGGSAPDYNYRLIYFSFGVNGRVSYGGVLACCDINEKMLEKTLSVPKPTMVDGTLLPYEFIADEAFELRDDLMKPFNASVLNHERRICNYRFSRAR
ncbi:hypothetical protein J6590_032430 [Homalodisca vitripennis]|nr:hypothetical protein J6590_032430 [Homalodisca vitripennis]